MRFYDYLDKSRCGRLTKEDAMVLARWDLEELCHGADVLRQEFFGNAFDLCAIINGKSGRCPENCRYCAQSAYYPTEVETYPLLETDAIVDDALDCHRRGIGRYSVVTSGRSLTAEETKDLCQSYRIVKCQCGISLCASHGLLTKEQFQQLKSAGVARYHCNLETSRRFFSQICTTHTYDDKIAVLRAAASAGLELCSGGIFGMGETMEDRIDMAFDLRAMGIASVPMNLLNPIGGTPMEDRPVLTNKEFCRTVALYRMILPRAVLRTAGGRGLLPDKGRKAFLSGANGAITGDMLTTAGITVEGDQLLLKELGFEVKQI